MGFLRKFLANKETLTDKLLKCVDDYEIYCTLCNCDIELGETIHSPIRGTDDCPSFAVYIPTRAKREVRPEELWFKDLAYGKFGDVFTFVKYFAEHNFNLNLDTV